MKMLEQFRKAGLSDTDIINTFKFRAGISTKFGNRSYRLGNLENPESFLVELHFNKEGKLFKIKPGTLLATEKSQLKLVESALNDINSDHGYVISHRVLFSHRPLKGKFQWKDVFRIKPCLNNSQIGKGLAWGIENHNGLKDIEKHLGPPFPFILEVRTKRSPNYLIETNRSREALDFYQWLLGLLIPHLLGTPYGINGQLIWTVMRSENIPEYHLAYAGFNAHESEKEIGQNFSSLNIPDVIRYSGEVDYYNHIWSQSSEIEMPVEMEVYLNLFHSLPIASKENFRRSLYWFNTGSRLCNQEQLSIIPFTIAIECLLPNPSEVCPTCNRTRGDGTTKLFNEFMAKYLSLPTNINHLKENMYPNRSDMIHGKFISAADQGFFSILNYDVSELAIENFTRRALVKWLLNGTF